MDVESYNRWYETPRGRWIGQREAALVMENLQLRRGESLLDVGCGTGFFTLTLAPSMDGPVVGVDINPECVRLARDRGGREASFEIADARALPFPTASFDLVMSITALCFIEEDEFAVREILRVARRRFAVGLLNRRSLLWLKKGRGGGQGGYRGARWHTVGEARGLFRGLPVEDLRVRTAVQLPSGGPFARFFEHLWPSSLPFGAFILVFGDVEKGENTRHSGSQAG